MTELNPNHPVTREMHDHWHKLVGVLLYKFGLDIVEIMPADLEGFAEYLEGGGVAIEEKNGRLFLRLVVGADEAAALARKEGGLPC